MQWFVTVCGRFQSAGLKPRLAGEGVPSPGFVLTSGIVTVDAGCDWSTIVASALSPDSLVTSPEVGLTMMAAASAAMNALENSEVLEKSSDVAVTPTASPIATFAAIVVSNGALPDPSQATSVSPR